MASDKTFDHPGMISELAAEMKSFEKSLPGGKYVVDRRHQSPVLETAAAGEAETLACAVSLGSSQADT